MAQVVQPKLPLLANLLASQAGRSFKQPPSHILYNYKAQTGNQR